ncbi:MAG: histidine phosphatase family protein [Kangiellaceae bacterium]
MQHIYLIRHGQASFGAENYDKLSALGQRQAKVIGEYFAQQNIKIAHIIHGQMSRQQETAELIAKHANFNNKLILHKGANEFDSEHLIEHYLPILAKQSLKLRQTMESGDDWWAKGENFEIFFRALVALWQQDDYCPFESWEHFKQRCLNCLTDVAQISEQAKTKNSENRGATLVATSGGLISVIMQSILASDTSSFNNRAFMDMNLTINNTSMTEVVWQANQPVDSMTEDLTFKYRNRLICFNNVTPLLLAKESDLITRK